MGNPFGNLGGVMKQAKKMYEQVQKVQEELAEERVEAASGGGMVKAVVSGKGELVEIKIDRQVVDPEDVEMLEDLVVSSVREAQGAAERLREERMKSAAGGLGIPGLF